MEKDKKCCGNCSCANKELDLDSIMEELENDSELKEAVKNKLKIDTYKPKRHSKASKNRKGLDDFMYEALTSSN